MSTLASLIQFLVYGFLFSILLGIVWVIYAYFVDRYQKKSTLRRNFPVLARFRYLFERLGEFFRQYFFAMDREEMPFNRAERSWVYRAAKNVDSTVAFGSSRDLRPVGAVYFANCTFPFLEEEFDEISEVTVGPYCKKPYTTRAFFNISGMSYGAISKPAVKALSKGAQMAGVWLNTGEGGLSPYHLESGCDIVFQFGTGKFGVAEPGKPLSEEKIKNIAKHDQVKMFEIKLAQGAKPGKGGILPGIKVNKEIAEIRGLKPGQDAVSPNRHAEISNINDLLDMVIYVRKASEKPVGFKTVVGDYEFFEDLCRRIKKRGIKKAPDFITIDGADGGTGAAPMSLIDNMGIPLREALPKVADILTKHGLKDRIKLVASGKLINPTDVAWALCAGADFVNSGRGFLFALGCIQAMQCNKNTCPTGITTHKKHLQYGLDPQNKGVRVASYAKNMHKEVSIIAHSCGIKEPREFNRTHARIVQQNGQSARMDEIFPDPTKKTA